MKELSADPKMGKILSVKHIERVGRDRTAHTFVRGPWNMKEMNTTVFFTKCCHDVDFVLWITGGQVKSVRSEKGTRIFTPEQAPSGAADRCVRCSVEHDCPYSAVDLYLRRRDWIKGFVAKPGETQEEMIVRMLDESRYGRCVYCCPENDVIDRQSVVMEMADGVKAEVIMECVTDQKDRYTVIECENAVITGDESFIEVTYKAPSVPQEKYDFQWTRGMELHATGPLEAVLFLRYGRILISDLYERFVSCNHCVFTFDHSISVLLIGHTFHDHFRLYAVCHFHYNRLAVNHVVFRTVVYTSSIA